MSTISNLHNTNQAEADSIAEETVNRQADARRKIFLEVYNAIKSVISNREQSVQEAVLNGCRLPLVKYSRKFMFLLIVTPTEIIERLRLKPARKPIL